jgi:hypothetical protein
MVVSTWKMKEDGDRWESRFVPKYLEKQAKKRIKAIRKRQRDRGRWFERGNEVARGDELIDRVTPSPLPPKWKRTQDTSDPWMMRYLQGFTPLAASLEIRIVGLVSRNGNIETYQALVNGNYKATLTVVIDSEDQYDPVMDGLASKYKKRSTPYLTGADFILSYDNVSSEELVKLK